MEQMFLKFLVIIGSVNEDCLQTKPLPWPMTMTIWYPVLNVLNIGQVVTIMVATNITG